MALEPSSTIAIVGASLAGLRAAETVRAEGHTGPVVMIGAEPHLPYDRPPLSKQFLAGTWGLDRVLLRPAEKITALGLDLRLGHSAGALDVEGHTLELDDGTTVRFDGLVLATGAHPRPLPQTDPLAGVHMLRTLEDSIALGEATRAPGARVVVVGAGFIGSEVAATCRGLGARVTVVEALSQPLARVLGPEMGAACGALAPRPRGRAPDRRRGARRAVGPRRCHGRRRRARRRHRARRGGRGDRHRCRPHHTLAGGFGARDLRWRGRRRHLARRRRRGGGRGHGALVRPGPR